MSKGDQLFKASMLNNVGLCYFHLSKNDSALVYFNKAFGELQIPNKKGTPSRLPVYLEYFGKVIQGNIAKIDIQRGNYDMALKAFKQELNYQDKIFEYGIITAAYTNIAKAYFLKNEHQKALVYIDSSLRSLTSYNSVEDRIKALKLKGRILLATGNFETAKTTIARHEHLSDSLQKIRVARNYLANAVQYKTEENKKELKAIRQEVLLKRKLTRNQWLALLMAGILLSTLIYFYWKAKKDKKTIAVQNNTLEGALHEKEILLKEVHHRVKNNLQVISGLLQIQGSKSESGKMKNTLDDTQRHIQSMALVHQMLYEQGDISVIPMQAYLNKLINELLFTLSGKHIEASITADDIQLSLDRAIPLGLMINELITNTNKHAFDGG